MVTLRVTDYPARSAMAPHRHDELSLIVVTGGEYVERMRGVEVEHCAGRMLLYPAHAIHSQRFGGAGARKIVFTPAPTSMEFLRDHGVALDVARHVDAPIVAQLARRVLTEVGNDDPFTPLALEGLTLELVAAFGRADRSCGHASPPAWLRAAHDAICEGADETVSLTAIAASVGRHPIHLAREFRRYYGVTIGTYRRQLRLRRAEGMLAKNVGLTEIAFTCGFSSHSHFCRSFKAAYGVSPSQFRLAASG